MAFDPKDKELIDGRANKRPSEARPVDNKDRSLWRQYENQPDWGRGMENSLETKRGLPSRVPGYGGYRTRRPGQ